MGPCTASFISYAYENRDLTAAAGRDARAHADLLAGWCTSTRVRARARGLSIVVSRTSRWRAVQCHRVQYSRRGRGRVLVWCQEFGSFAAGYSIIKLITIANINGTREQAWRTGPAG